MLYFGYGSNLNDDDLRRFDVVLRPVGRALLHDHALAFNYRSETRGGGALSVVPAPGRDVAGVLFEADERAWSVLDRKEGARVGCYQRKNVKVSLDGQLVEAVTYVTSPHREERFVPPQAEYLRVVEQGYLRHGLDTSPLHRAAEGEHGTSPATGTDAE